VEAAPRFTKLCCWAASHLLRCSDSPFGCRYQDTVFRNTVCYERQPKGTGYILLPQPLRSFLLYAVELCFLPHTLFISCTRSFHFVPSCTLSKSHMRMHTNIALHRLPCRSRTHPLFSCHKGAGRLPFSTSALGVCSACSSSGAGQRPLFCNCAT